ncbi:2-ketogluconate reductase [Caballeronia arationis]|jgi:phosphogluconate 2-dehydrogenase/gluconate 2-dehydrogenase|uniref:Glyoxylate/hydroxypyruvate reductase B n=1 Tax=Caballeronia arationis TaxID=1777142 RepID=A0A7Z7I9K3_9BURK|nr:D-glycerate dehydrogenase [Caballeronia arationis]SAK77000.1 2-ketogluconate reductase [Caballeronia arationis]SOE81663.1 Lactate dehydrogenase [Caballeronia arationis]
MSTQSTARKHVVVFRKIPDDLLERIREWHDVTIADPRRAEELPRFREALHDADGLIGSSFKLGAQELDRAPRLQVISSISVGVDNYDLACLKRRGITLCHTPGVLTETTADTVFALIIAASRRLVELSNHVRDGGWTRNIGEDLFGWDVHGKTLGVLGFGRIGQAVARRAALGFDMPVVFHDPFDVQVPASLAQHAVRASFDEVLRRADIVALTLPLSDETRGLMDAQAFSAMKPGAIFVNGSRGAIVREDALLAALDSGHLRAAGLDVFAVEPLPQDSPLRTHPKVTPFPHIGSATHETRRAMAELATQNLLRVLDGEAAVAAYDLSKE